jgi:hypothetical protein
MIISHRHRYLFVEVPRTGSTAISAELEKHYEGQRILTKHAHYSTFLRQATEDEKKYLVISGVRNPLDDTVSYYRKLSTKKFHGKGHRRHLRRQRFIQKNSATFSDFLHNCYRLPFDMWTNTYHRQFDVIIRFENLQEEFGRAIDRIGAELVRPLPVVNKTDRRADYMSYYSGSDIEKAVWIFGPYMKTWGYEFPTQWGNPKVPFSSWVIYRILQPPRQLYWNHLRQGEWYGARMLRKYFLE